MKEDGTFEKGQVPWNKGTKKVTDLTEIRKCETCNEEKIITEFVKGQKGLYRYLCKVCRQKSRRTGRPNTGKFQVGHDKGKRFEKENVPWHAGTKDVKPGKLINPTKRFEGKYYREWKKKVFEQKGDKCMRCGSDYYVAAHHIIPWKDNEELRFDVSNGLPLCCSCHGKEEGFKKGRKARNKTPV